MLFGGCNGRHNAGTAIRIRWAHDPESLEPMASHNQEAIDANNLLHISLLQASSELLQPLPALAEQLPEVRYLPDSLMTLRYRLRPQARWDDGQPVLATDVAFSLKLMSCPGLPNEIVRNQFTFMRTFVPDLLNPRGFTLGCLGHSPEFVVASGDFCILPEARIDPHHRLRRYSLRALQLLPATQTTDTALLALSRDYQALDLARHPERVAGCGPYRLTGWQKDRRLSFRRKATWWADQLPRAPLPLQARAAQLDYVIIPEATAATLALRRGDLDVYPQVPARDFARLRAATTQRPLRCYTTPSYDVVTAGFNTRRPALAAAPTRRALSRLFDAAGLLRATQLGEGRRTVGIISPLDRTNYNDSLSLIPFAPAEATRLLRKAGWQQASGPAGQWHRPGTGQNKALGLTVRYRAEDDLMATIALQFRAAAQVQGIAVRLQPTESGQFAAALRAGDFDVYLRTLKGNPFVFNFTPLLHSSAVGEGNLTGFGTPTSDRLIETLATAESPARRAVLLHRFQALLQQEMPLVPLFFLPNRVAAAANLTGLHVGSLKPGFTAATIERAIPAP